MKQGTDRHEERVAELLNYSNKQVEKRRAATDLLREAGIRFREYEANHREKVEPEDGSHTRYMLNESATRKADRNAEIASRIETFLQEIHK